MKTETRAAVAEALGAQFDWVNRVLVVPADCTREQLVSAGENPDDDTPPSDLASVVKAIKSQGVSESDIAVKLAKAYGISAIKGKKQKQRPTG